MSDDIVFRVARVICASVGGSWDAMRWHDMANAAIAEVRYTDATAVSSAPDAVAEDDSTLPTLDDVKGILCGYGPPSEPVTRAEFEALSAKFSKLDAELDRVSAGVNDLEEFLRGENGANRKNLMALALRLDALIAGLGHGA